MTMNAAALLLAAGAPRHTALVCGADSLSYEALRLAVARAAGAWRELGVREGEPVVIRLADGIDWVVAYLGALWAGAVAVAVNPRVPRDEWQRMSNEAGWRFVLAESRGGALAGAGDAVLTLAEWKCLALTASAMDPVPMQPDAPACWSHSSGTSGAAKAVVHAHRFALHVERVAAELLGVRAEDRLFASSKLFFVYPLANSLFAGLKLGATVVLDPAWPTEADVAATVATQRPSVFFSVPSLYRRLLQQGLASRIAAAGVRLSVSAGEALPHQVREAWHAQTGMTLVDGYGASETMCLALVDRGDGLQPAPGVAVGWAERHDDAAPGRVLIDSPTQALGYWQRPQAQAEHFRAGGFCPGDLFERRDGGPWRFAGREDSLVKVSGRWVDLSALEERFVQTGGTLQEAAAVALHDDGIAEIALFYVPRDDAVDAAEAALAELIHALPSHQRPRWLHRVPALPRGPTGKLLRRQLQQLHASRPDEARAA